MVERHQEHHRIVGMKSDIITITFAAPVRIFPATISSSLRTASPSLPADDYNVLPCSVMTTAMALDELAVAASSGRRGNVVSMNDSLTSDLEHLAHLCVAAEPFDFDVRIATLISKSLANCTSFLSRQHPNSAWSVMQQWQATGSGSTVMSCARPSSDIVKDSMSVSLTNICSTLRLRHRRSRIVEKVQNFR
jgi:hypothetical protein